MQQDIIIPLAGDTEAWVWAEAVELTRQGTRPVPSLDGVEDRWQIAVPVRASLAQGGQALLRDGAEIAIPSPIPAVRVDVADLLHDPEVQQALRLVRSVAVRLLTGDLKPKHQEPAP
jgi:hypothetical protein